MAKAFLNGQTAVRHKQPDDPKKRKQAPSKSTKSSASKDVSKKQQKILEPRSDWHAVELPDIPIPISVKSVPLRLIERIQSHAKQLLEKEAANYTSSHAQTSSSYKFMSTIMSSGTWSDKVSALTLVVQESPLHTSKQLENLIGLAGKHSRTQALMALAALKDLFAQGAILPSERKLRPFAKQPGLLACLQGVPATWTERDGLPMDLKEIHLITWAFEDVLKSLYFEVLKILEKWCNDEVEYSRSRAVSFIWELLKERPEQEENLLRLLVNKLGDKSKKVASRASHLLLQLEVTHPSMKTIITNSIESDILLRGSQSLHAKYYAVITLNQTILKTDSPDLANKLLDVYFSLFVAILNRSSGPKTPVPQKAASGKKRKRSQTANAGNVDLSQQELEDKIIAQVLTGVNRAFPFSEKDGISFEKHLDTLFRITHSANFNTSIKALMLIQQTSQVHHVSMDRYMRTLYESLLDPRLVKSSKQTMYLNLLYRSIKEDPSIRRVKAFVKRLLQILSCHEPPFITAGLFLIMELQNIFPSLKSMLDQPELQDDDEDEVFHDVPEDSVDEKIHGESIAPVNNLTHTFDTMETSKTAAKAIGLYDGRKRDPEHSHAERTCLWELAPWNMHYHPSVAVFAKYISSLKSQQQAKAAGAQAVPVAAPPKPDPNTHTLIHFLDRFIYKNPKQPKASSSSLSSDAALLRGSSLMQPALASSNTTDHLLLSGGAAGDSSRNSSKAAKSAAELNSEVFWNRRVEDVAPEEVFFHRYFSELGSRGRKKKVVEGEKDKKKQRHAKGEDEDGESRFSDLEGEDEDAIWSAMVGSQPGLEDAGDFDDDDDMEGFDDEDMEDYDDDDDVVMEAKGEDAAATDEWDVEIHDVDSDDASDTVLNRHDDDNDDDDDDDDDDDEGPMVLEDLEDIDSLDSDSGHSERSSYTSTSGDDDEVQAEPGMNGREEQQQQQFTNQIKTKTKSKSSAATATATASAAAKNRKRLKALPTFASAEDYAALIDQGNSGDDNDDNA